ncbi:MAG TPA: extracellular solute-binding protein [Methylococcaceae bacterium]|nr:extracellular solute-binding protein [Methylococcaceae bacterium]
MSQCRYFIFVLFLAFLVPPMAGAGESGTEIVVYSARHEPLIKPLFDTYAKKTGVEVKFITGEAGALMQRLKAEGTRTPADILLTVDAGNLWFAKREGLLQPVQSPALEANIPAHLRDPDKQWFGLSVRARTLVYNTQKVSPSDLSTYQALAEPQWKGRLCLRSSKKVYNQSLVAMLIAEYGEAETLNIVKGWVANLAAPVYSDDEQVLPAVAAGQCDVGIVNSYYYGRLLKKQADLPLALFWADQGAGGVHVNVSGAGVTRHARHAQAAQALLEWLSSEEAQGVFANANLEYPANPKVAPDPAVAAWGSFKQNTRNLGQAGAMQAQAIRLMDEAGYH